MYSLDFNSLRYQHQLQGIGYKNMISMEKKTVFHIKLMLINDNPVRIVRSLMCLSLTSPVSDFPLMSGCLNTEMDHQAITASSSATNSWQII